MIIVFAGSLFYRYSTISVHIQWALDKNLTQHDSRHKGGIQKKTRMTPILHPGRGTLGPIPRRLFTLQGIAVSASTLCLFRSTRQRPKTSQVLRGLFQSWLGRSGPNAAPPVERAYKFAFSTVAWRTWDEPDDVSFNWIRSTAPPGVLRELLAWPRPSSVRLSRPRSVQVRPGTKFRCKL